MAETKRTLIEQLFRDRYSLVYSFFFRRTRSAPDAADLSQEVFSRLLRVQNYDEIREPEHYLLTIAKNLLLEHTAADRQRRGNGSILVEDTICQDELAIAPEFGGQLDSEQRVERLRTVLGQLPAKAQAVMVMNYLQGHSYEEIAQKLDISTHMVKKYVTQSLSLCRIRMKRMR